MSLGNGVFERLAIIFLMGLLCSGIARASTNTIRVMTFNIHHGEGLDGVIDTQRIGDLIQQENADLVGLQEVDVGTARVSGRNLIAEIAQHTGMQYVFSNNFSFQGGQYGNGILSRFPIKARDHRLLPNVGSSEQRGWLKVIVDAWGTDLSFWVTHLDARSTNVERLYCVTNFNTWLAQETVPVIFVGDFNDNPASTVHARMAASWQDTWTLAGQGPGLTMPSSFPAQRIDYIWTGNSTSLQPVQASVPVTTISDHRPVVLELNFNVVPSTNKPAGTYFPLNEGAGSSFTNSAGTLFGTLESPAPVWTNSTPSGLMLDRALFFAGNALAKVPDPAHLISLSPTNGDYTLQTWVRLPAGFSPATRMVMFQYEGSPGFSFSITTARTLHTTTFGQRDLDSAVVLPDDGAWHHAAVVHQSGVEMRFYIDGTLASTVAYTNGPGARSNDSITIGGASSGANMFTGFLDRIRYAPLALAPQELDAAVMSPSSIVLRLVRSGASATLRWPVTEAGYSLEASSTLGSPWAALSFSQQGEEYQSVISLTESNRFYRLRRVQ